MALTLFALANIMIYLLISLHPPLLKVLWLSADRPWGILTSAFTHADLAHLARNLAGFTLAALLFIPVSSVWSAKIRSHWSRVFLWLAFLSGIGANAIEYPSLLIGPNSNILGASGIAYGAFGVLLAACIWSLPTYLKALSNELRHTRKRRKRGFRLGRGFMKAFRALFALAFPLSFIIQILTDMGGFLGVGPGVHVSAHVFGFLGGFGGAMVLLRFGFRRAQFARPPRTTVA